MKKHYSIIKYHGYVIEGCGRVYDMYYDNNYVGEFSTFAEAKKYIDDEEKLFTELWNKAVIDELIEMGHPFYV